MTKKKKQTHSRVIHQAKHIFVPHKGNNYRPHLIRWRGLAVVLALALVLQVTYSFVATGRVQVLGRVTNITIDDLLKETNVEREKVGLSDLTINSQLDRAAYAKAQDMLANNYWAHTSPSGITPWKWLADAGYDYTMAGENLAKNYPTSQATVNAWMASPTHKANVLGDKYKEVGFAIIDGTLNNEQTTLVVAYYGDPADAAVAGTESTPVKTYVAPVTSSNNPLVNFGSAIQSLSPATVGVLGLLTLVGLVAAVAHHYRNKLPKGWRQSWRVHHGAYTLTGVIVLGFIIIVATGGGQI